MNVTTFENSRWSTFDQHVEFRHRAAMELIPEGSVLDIGCGDGVLLTLLQKKGIQGEGADLSEEAVRKVIEKGFMARVIDPGKSLPYADKSFDTVVLLDVLEHVYEPAALLRDAARISRSVVVVGVPNFSSLPARLQTLMGTVPENNRPSKGHIYWFNYAALRRVASESHMHVRRLIMNTFFPFSLAGDFFTRLLPNLFALSFIVKLEKMHE